MSIAVTPGDQRDSLRSKDSDGNRWYNYPPTGERFISVTAVHGATEGKPWLVNWSAKRAALRLVDNVAAITTMLERDGRDDTLAYLAKDAERDRQLKADTGTYVHDVVEALILWAASPEGTGTEIVLPVLPDDLQGQDYDDDPVEDIADLMTDGFLRFVKDWEPRFEAAEMTVYHPGLKMAGTLDIIAKLHGYAIDPHLNMFVPAPGNVLTGCIDVKTGKWPSVTWQEQIAAYRRMRECLLPMGQLVPMPATDFGAVLRLRPEYDDGYKLMLVSGDDDAKAWRTFVGALHLFQDRAAAKAKPGKVVYPAGEDGTIPAPLLADLDGEGYGRALAPLAKAGLRSLADLAALDSRQCQAIKGVGPKTVSALRELLASYRLSFTGEES